MYNIGKTVLCIEIKTKRCKIEYNLIKGKIKLKVDHIKRVEKISEELANYLNLNEEQIRLAKAIGIFHDIGRFKQVEMYDTYHLRKNL